MVIDQLELRQGTGPNEFPPGFLEQSRAPQIVAGNVVCQIIGSLFFFARAYSRLGIIKTWKTEDYVLSAAWILITGYSICQYGQIAHGAGHHIAAIVMENPQDTVEAQKYAFAAQLILFNALAMPKLSICLSYTRLFYTNVGDRRMIKGLMVVLILSIIPFFIEAIFQCKPIHLYWTEGRPDEKCLNDLSGLYINGSMNVAVDLSLIAIVLPRVLELHLNTRQRWALIGIVCLGFLAVIAGIVRMVRVGTTLDRADEENFDATWEAYDISIWSATELYVSLICASAPGMKPFVSKVLPKLLGSSLRSTGPSHGNAAQKSIELSTRLRSKSAMHTARWSESEAGLTTEVVVGGRSADADSILSGESEQDVKEADERGIYKTSEVTVQTTSVLR